MFQVNMTIFKDYVDCTTSEVVNIAQLPFFYQENEQLQKVTHTRDYLKPYINMRYINQHKNGVESSLMT